MVLIKHILQETGVSEIFKLIVPSGAFQGEYAISKPQGWNNIDSIIDINNEFFNVENFILGDKEKLVFSEFGNDTAYNLIKNVYNEQGADGTIVFKWIAVKDSIEYDLLSENFEINLNKASFSFDKTKMKVTVELIKRESQNKLATRDDVTVDLFSTKDLDGKDISPIQPFEIGYKKGDSRLSNFYFYTVGQQSFGRDNASVKFFSFTLSGDRQFGSNTNEQAGLENLPGPTFRKDHGPFVTTAVSLTMVTIEISNFDINARTSGGNFYPDIRLFAVIRVDGAFVKNIELKSYTENLDGAIHYSRITIDNEIFSIGSMDPGWSLHIEIRDINGGDFQLFGLKDTTSIKITTNLEQPLVKSKGIKLIDALNKVVGNLTSSEMTVSSSILGSGGVFNNTSITTGVFLRGLSELYLKNKVNTSFKGLFMDGISKILAMGYDTYNNELVVENVDYFFKDHQIYDLSEGMYIGESFKIDHDSDISCNTLLFGSKKISTKNDNDLENFVTSAEITTPIKTFKSKFDKQTELILDEYKIRDLIEDQTKSTNDSDDDLVMIDLVDATNYFDTGVFKKCLHSNNNGKLVLKCLDLPFDTTMMQVNYAVEIVQGINLGTYFILAINGAELTLDTNLSIQTGEVDTAIKYFIPSVTKNRTSEGFENALNIKNLNVSTNIRHNPKYHMARWFPYFGGGLTKKTGSELLKVTKFKNNSQASIVINSSEMQNELQGQIVVGADETLSRLRTHKKPFFSGETVEITYARVTFEEFLLLYNNWKFGEGNDRSKSRGYIVCNTPYGKYKVFPFGDKAFSHNKAKNTLSIKGKIKGKRLPYIKLKWDNINGGTQIMICKQAVFGYNIFVEVYDGEIDITSVEIFKKTDDGNWVLFTTNIINDIFSDSISSGTHTYKAIVTFASGEVLESNILQYQKNTINIISPGQVTQTIYKRDSGSHGIGQTKIKDLKAVIDDGSLITKIEVRCKFRAIGENIWSDITESLEINPGSDSVNINNQWVYGFKDPSKYIGSRDWNGADNLFCEVKIYTSFGDIKVLNPAFDLQWYDNYPASVVL